MTRRACALLLASLGVTGCPGARSSSTAGDGAVAAPRASEPAASMRLAHRWIVTSRLDPANIGTFTRLTPARRATLDDLVSRSTVPLEVYASQGQLLLRLSARHPAGPMDLLLQEDQDQIRGHLPRSKLRFDAPLDHLPDLLDGRSGSTRADFGAELSAAAPPRPTAASAIKTAELDATLTFRYLPRPGHPLSWPIQQQVQILFADSPRPFFSVFQQPLLHVVLPLLQARRGVLLLESLAWNVTAAPVAWSTTTSNEGQPGGQPPTFRASVEDQGWVWIPSSLMAASRSGYHEGRPSPGSSQLVPATQLAALRPTQSAGPLTVENHGGSSAMVYADGILMGRVADRQKLAIKGLPAGFYQLYAVSPSGVRCWGPHPLYVPGPWTLR